MKVVFHTPLHVKNSNAIAKMCASKCIELEFTNDDDRIVRPDYDILIMNTKFIDPALIPPQIKIIYGPQHFVFPSGPLVGKLNPEWAERCVFNCLSDWNKQVYIEFVESLCVPIFPFPFSVDIDRFCPSNSNRDIDCIIYIKRRHPSICEAILNEIRKQDLKIQCYTYGDYRENDYLGGLQRAKFMICIDAHESQGFAIEEAMACNVPLLVIDAQSMHDEYDSNKFTYGALYSDKSLNATSVPYWSDQCGIKINDVSEFPTALSKMRESWQSFRPRDFVISTLSPHVCMNRILNYFHLL